MNRTFGIILTVCLLSFQAASQAKADEIVELLAEEARQIDFESLSTFRSMTLLLSIAESAEKMEQTELAKEFLQRAIKIANKDEKRRYHRSLFSYAVAIDRLDLAEEFANESLAAKDSLLDKLDVEHYRRGDPDAVKNYPREEQTFYNALDLVNAYIERGEYEKAEEYVTDIKISEENDPRAVAGITFQKIAEKHRREGDMENAILWIDKAFAVGGRLFYTGYSIETTHRSMHGTLKKDLRNFARRGARHPDHMGRELVQLLIRELRESGDFKEAEQTANLLKDKKDVYKSRMRTAESYARKNEMGEAFRIVTTIQDPEIQGLARIQLAHILWENGETESARNLVAVVRKNAKMESEYKERDYLKRLASLYAKMEDLAKLQQVLSLKTEPAARGFIIAEAFKGCVESLVEK